MSQVAAVYAGYCRGHSPGRHGVQRLRQQSNTNPCSHANTRSDTDANSYAHAHSDADTHSHANSDTDAGTNDPCSCYGRGPAPSARGD